MLDYDDQRWETLQASPGGTGELAARLLSQIRDGKGVDAAYAELYEQICHQGTVGEVAYAVVPHLIDIAKQSRPEQQYQPLAQIAAVLTCSVWFPDVCPAVPADLHGDYEEAKLQALRLAASRLQNHELDPVESLHMIQLVAIVHGQSTIAILIQRWPDYTCPSCDEVIDFGDIDDAANGANDPAHSPEVSEVPPTARRKKWWRFW
jgi:hypothetical protein